MWYNPKKRKPLLQIKILETLALRGACSKRGLERVFHERAKISNAATRPHYKEISDACARLYKKGFVERQASILAAREKFYGLTNKGLHVLLGEIQSIGKSWTLVIAHCLRSNKQSKSASFAEIHDIMMSKFLPYHSLGDYSYILKIFLGTCRKFINEIIDQDKFVKNVLFALGECQSATLGEIVSITGKDYSVINSAIEKVSMDCSDYTDIYDLTHEVDMENQRLRFMDFLQHCLIFSYYKDGKIRYELSLFGIVIILIVLRRRETINANRARALDFEKKLNLFARIYHKHKLPLIFGKWWSIRTILKTWSFYNFDNLLSYDRVESRSLVMGGTGEIFESVYAMYVLNNITREQLLKAGIEMLEVFQKKPSQIDFNFEKRTQEGKDVILNGITSLKKYLNFRYTYLRIDNSIDEIFRELKKRPVQIKDEYIWGRDRLHPLKLLEKSFSDELTLLYYINLMNLSYEPFPLGKLLVTILQDVSESINENLTNPISPRDNLRLLIKRDIAIRNFILRFRNDSLKYEEELSVRKRALYDSLI